MSRSPALEGEVGFGTDAAPPPFLYRVLRRPLRALLGRHFEFTVAGLEHVPDRGPFIVAANHHNYLDGIVLAIAIPRPISFLVMPRVYRATPFHPLLHRHVGSIRIDLERHDVGALRRALGVLDAGRIVGIFPEGPFSVRGKLEAGLHGVGLLALRSGAPVVPAGIRGTYEALVARRAYIPRRHPITVSFGPATTFSPGLARERRVTRASVTARIMDDIASLLT